MQILLLMLGFAAVVLAQVGPQVTEIPACVVRKHHDLRDYITNEQIEKL